MYNTISKQVKVCHVTNAHTRFDVRIFHKECVSLAKGGFDVTLLVNDALPDEYTKGIKIISTKYKPRNRFQRMITSKGILKRKMAQIDADLYHFHDPELLPEAVWIKKIGKKVIFDFHEDVSQQILYKHWIPYPIRKIVSTLYRNYESKTIKSFDGIVTVTPKFVERLRAINSNTTMVTNYPIVGDIQIHGIKKKRTICFAGGVSEQWNHINIIKAIELINNVEYVLAGNGSREYLNRLQDLNGWRKVKYLGRIPHEEVKEVYKKSLIGMTLLSYKTQVGNEGTLGNTKLFEFMEAGLPIICSDNEVWREIIERYKCGIAINPNNVEEIAESIEYLLNNEHIANKMGENGRTTVQEVFNWKSQEKNLLDLYKSLL